MNEEQMQIVANYLGITIEKVYACNDVVENGLTKYAAEKKYGIPPNTIVRHIKKFNKLLTMLKEMGEAEVRANAINEQSASG